MSIKGFRSKYRKKITYPNLDSVLRSVSHNPSMPATIPPEDGLSSLADELVFDKDTSSASSDASGYEYEPEENLKPILLFTQDQLNNLIKDLELSKQKAEFLASWLQENNLLQKDMLVSHCRKHNADLSTVFRLDGPLCYCHDITSLFEKLGENHIASEWRLFLDQTWANNGPRAKSSPQVLSFWPASTYTNLNSHRELSGRPFFPLEIMNGSDFQKNKPQWCKIGIKNEKNEVKIFYFEDHICTWSVISKKRSSPCFLVFQSACGLQL